MSLSEQVIESKSVFHGRLLTVRVDTVRLQNGKTSTREIVEHPGAVAMVPMADAETVILVRQDRLPAGQRLLEIPAGTLNPGEEPETCAHRELAEEIQQRAGRMIKLCSFYTAPGYATEKIDAFLALDLSAEAGHADEDEFLQIERMPLAEAIKLIATGGIQDAKTIAGLLCAARVLPDLASES